MARKKKSTTKKFRKLLSKKELNVCNKKMMTKIATTSVSSMDTDGRNPSSEISISEFICPESQIVEEIGRLLYS